MRIAIPILAVLIVVGVIVALVMMGDGLVLDSIGAGTNILEPYNTTTPTPQPTPTTLTTSDPNRIATNEIVTTTTDAVADIVVPYRLQGNMTWRVTWGFSNDVLSEPDLVRIVAEVRAIEREDDEWLLHFAANAPIIHTLSDMSHVNLDQPYDAIAQMRSNRVLIADGTIDPFTESRIVWTLITAMPADQVLPEEPRTCP